jgi:hypothetical protein
MTHALDKSLVLEVVNKQTNKPLSLYAVLYQYNLIL